MNRKTIAIGVGAALLVTAAGFTAVAAGHRMGGWRHGMEGFGGHGGGMFRMLEQLDANKDGKLTQEEIDTGRKDALARSDADKDGKLTLAEYEKVWLEQMRPMMVRQFQHLDADGDAAVTADEFGKPFAGIVARMDRNDDGALDESDRRRGWGGKHRRGHGEGGGPGMEPAPGPGMSPPAGDEAPAPDTP